MDNTKRHLRKSLFLVTLSGFIYYYSLFRTAQQLPHAYILIFAILPALVVFVIFYQAVKSVYRQTEESMELKTLRDNLSVGVLRCRVDDLFLVQYASESALKLLGYSQQEFFEQLGGNLSSIMDKSDGRRVAAEYQTCLQRGETEFKFEFRLRNRQGKNIWLMEYAKVATTMGGKYLSIVMMDISASKQTLQDKAISDECYRIIYNTSDVAIFDFDAANQRILQQESFIRKFGWNMPDGSYPGELKEFVHPEDYQKIQNMFLKIQTSDSSCVNDEVRFITMEGSYIWCDVDLYGIRRDDGEIVRIIGKLIDINENKQEALLFKLKSLKDAMTGVYNKNAVKTLVDQYLSSAENQRHYGFFILDIDDFKRVNDSYGHMEGDRIIICVARVLEQELPKNSIVGRIGGDEFVFFLKDIVQEDVEAIITPLFRVLAEVIVGNQYPVSVSVGLALPSEGENTHDSLYEYADNALYQAKYDGKNTIKIYGS